MSFVVATFYHFFDFKEFEQKKQLLKDQMLARGIKGSILIAPEGLNGTIGGTREKLDDFLSYLQSDIIRAPMGHKESYCDTLPFGRTKVRLKTETISLGEPVDLSQVGTYVDPKDWDALISDPDTIILDTRNDYEVHLGTFKGAIDPDIETFKQLPAFVRKTLSENKNAKIATFCTGGIRCEKFTAWMKTEGFTDVYHLKGGILKYLEEIPEAQSSWQGECYVFDDRVAVTHGVHASTTSSKCEACGFALTPEDRAHPSYVPDKACGFCNPLK